MSDLTKIFTKYLLRTLFAFPVETTAKYKRKQEHNNCKTFNLVTPSPYSLLSCYMISLHPAHTLYLLTPYQLLLCCIFRYNISPTFIPTTI